MDNKTITVRIRALAVLIFMMFIIQIDRNPKLRAKITILINCANRYQFSRNSLAVQIASAHNHAHAGERQRSSFNYNRK